MGDLQVVKAQSGEAALGMMYKQARSLGNRSFPPLVLQGSEQGSLEDGRPDRFVGPDFTVG
eukprot:10501677-Heterocapsa_arctica.AAC.1